MCYIICLELKNKSLSLYLSNFARFQEKKEKKSKSSLRSPDMGLSDHKSTRKKKSRKSTAANAHSSAHGPGGSGNASSNNILYGDHASHYASSGNLGHYLTPEQYAVNDMMRKALEEDQYSALGSIVLTDSSDDDGDDSVGGSAGGPSHGGNANSIVGRGSLVNATRKRLRLIKAGVPLGSNMVDVSATSNANAGSKSHNKNGDNRRGLSSNNSAANSSANIVSGGFYGEHVSSHKGPMNDPSSTYGNQEKDDTDSNSGTSGKKRKKKKGRKPGTKPNDNMQDGYNDDIMNDPNNDDSDGIGSIPTSSGNDESSIFGQTTGSANATWIQCDRCNKWRRLRGVVDAKKLPSKWYCSMNKNDPERASCSAEEEEYETHSAESAMDSRARKHLRLWVRRLQCNESYESRLPTMTRGSKKRSSAFSHSSSSSSGGGSGSGDKKGGVGGGGGFANSPYEWVRCCNPSCGKWRMLLRFMDAEKNVISGAKNGEWYCVLNTWDEKMASCAAPQENLPAFGCPPWIMQDVSSANNSNNSGRVEDK